MIINIFGSPLLRQYAVVLIANLNVVATGLSLAWASPVLVKLSSNDTVLSRPITEDEGSWIVSSVFLSGILTNFFVGCILDRLGRKYTLVLSCSSRVIIALMFIFAKEFWLIMVARLLSGILDSLSLTTVSTYASEIASNQIRGALGTLLQISCATGMLLVFGFGPFVSYLNLNIILLGVMIACVIPTLFLPDSPYSLYSKGKTEDARKVLLYLRGSDILANEELKALEIASKDDNQGKLEFRELFKNRLFLKATGIAFVLSICAQANGYTAVMFYLQTILETTRTSISSEVSSVIVGSLQVVGSFSTIFFSDRFGRKSILIVTTIGVTLGLIGLGAFFKVTENQDTVTGLMNYLPLASIIFIVFCHSAGIASISWVIIPEIYEGRTRALGSGVSLWVATTVGFVVTKTMPSLTGSIGPPMTYWMFSIICVSFIAFSLFCIPETKGRSFAEIQVLLGNKNNDGGKRTTDIEKSQKDIEDTDE